MIRTHHEHCTIAVIDADQLQKSGTYAYGSIAIHIAYLMHMKVDYKNVKLLLEKFKYDSDKRDVCGDLKILEFLIVCRVIKHGYTKYSCFLCL